MGLGAAEWHTFTQNCSGGYLDYKGAKVEARDEVGSYRRNLRE